MYRRLSGNSFSAIPRTLTVAAALLAVTAAFSFSLSSPVHAQTAGGNGGGGDEGQGGAGGSGGAGFNGTAGNAGSDNGNDVGGGGGGGGSAGGGNGGAGGAASGAGGTGGVGGSSGVPDGGPGGAPTANGGGGGGGGGYNGNGSGASAINNTATLQGGMGGQGATGGGAAIGDDDGGGGGGGAGGYGAVVTGAGASSNSTGGVIQGGTGGAGGAGGGGPLTHVGGNGGNGGDGGVGVVFTTSGATFTNAGTVTGGNGGAAGAAGCGFTFCGNAGSVGAGGAGVVGDGLTIINSGSISGGFAGDAVTQQDAIIFTGGANSVGNTGTISGGISVQGGSFAPALSTSAIGTPLTFSGPITFASGTQYVVRVSPSASDNLTASGAATLTGATVDAAFASGSYVSKQYTILTATGGLNGTTFAGVTNTNLPQGGSDSLSYSSDNVYLNLTAGFTNYTGLNTNQQNVANALTNYFDTTGGIPAAFFGVSQAGLTQLDGEAGTGAEASALQLTNEFLQLMLDPFVSGRGNAPGPGGGGNGAMGFAPDQRASLPPDVAQAYAEVLKTPPANFDQRWAAWGAAYGGANNASGDPAVGSTNLAAQTYGYAAGMDYRFAPYGVVGFALASGGTNWDLANGLGSGYSSAFQFGGYGIEWFGHAYLAGALSFTNNWFTTNRTALGDQLRANFSGQSYGARLEGGYRYAVLPTLGVTPYGAVQFQDFHTPKYSEDDLTGGGLGLSYNATNATDVRTELGARLDAPTLLYGTPLILFGRLAWAHDFVSNPSLSAAFEALPRTSFTVFGAPIPQNSALTTAGAQYFITANWQVITKFDGEFAAGYQTYAGTGTLRYTW